MLIGRLLDREATAEDRLRFERLAGSASDLWKTLALRQLDMVELSDRVCAATEPAERVDVIAAAPRRWSPRLALSGWAAAIVLGLWWMVAPGEVPRQQVQPAANSAVNAVAVETLTPRELLRRYLASPFVLGESDPILLEQQELPDGRHQIWFVRRIDETAIIDKPVDEVVGASGKFLVDPADLRRD
jgi:hypothetical protein